MGIGTLISLIPTFLLAHFKKLSFGKQIVILFVLVLLLSIYPYYVINGNENNEETKVECNCNCPEPFIYTPSKGVLDLPSKEGGSST